MLDVMDFSPGHAAEELARDSTLFEALENGSGGEVLRFWESREPAVVLGNSGIAEKEVRLAECEAAGVPVLRRISGGGAVLLGHGCLVYTLVLSMDIRAELRDVGLSYELILGRIARALCAQRCGLSDLAIGHRKISGNSQRRGRRALLHHGTVLYGFDLRCLGRFLQQPRREPPYRAGRQHSDFVTNLGLSRAETQSRLIQSIAKKLKH